MSIAEPTTTRAATTIRDAPARCTLVSLIKESWDTLRAVATIIDKVTALSDEVRALRAENRDLRDRVVRIDTIIDEARRQATTRRLPPRTPGRP